MDNCFINGQFLPSDQATIRVADLGLQRSYGVFDYARTLRGELFHFNDHLARFRQSAAELGLVPPASDDEISDIARQLIAESRFANPAIRLILTGGYADDPHPLENPNFIVSTEELPTYPPETYIHGKNLITVAYQRELPQVKSLNYMNSIRLLPLLRQKGAFDMLFYGVHGITECPRSNFFLFHGDTLVTAQAHILHGITRKIVLKLAPQKYSVEEREIALEELFTADEAFVTSTSKRVLPIVEVDGAPIGNGKVGKRTKTLLGLFDR
ncbi:MAG: aminotransferase IV [Chloroflexi bacterium]|jgi:branched-chain amino acid aminotransferase|nr:aminotransferase IV [Chloroflexota bacterium]